MWQPWRTHMPRDRDTADQEYLLEQIRRFPHKYPRSIGGLGPERITDADRLLDSQLPDETGYPEFRSEQNPPELMAFMRLAGENEAVHRDYADQATGEDPADHLGVHALDEGDDTFDRLADNDLEPGDDDDDRFDPEY